MTAPKRRWFRFTLRTMFVAVTVFCVWLGYSLSWIRQRHEFIASEEQFQEAQRVSHAIAYTQFGEQSVRAPLMVWVLGETGFAHIAVLSDNRMPQSLEGMRMPALTENDTNRMRRAQELFPEAEVRAEHAPPH